MNIVVVVWGISVLGFYAFAIHQTHHPMKRREKNEEHRSNTGGICCYWSFDREIDVVYEELVGEKSEFVCDCEFYLLRYSRLEAKNHRYG